MPANKVNFSVVFLQGGCVITTNSNICWIGLMHALPLCVYILEYDWKRSIGNEDIWSGRECNLPPGDSKDGALSNIRNADDFRIFYLWRSSTHPCIVCIIHDESNTARFRREVNWANYQVIVGIYYSAYLSIPVKTKRRFRRSFIT